MMKNSTAPITQSSAKPSNPGSKPSGKPAASKGSGLKYSPSSGASFLKDQANNPPKC